jgi:adenosine deaminase
MSEDQYMTNVKARNADIFAAEKFKMTPEELERLLRTAFRAGVYSERDATQPAGGEMPDFMRDFFGQPK